MNGQDYDVLSDFLEENSVVGLCSGKPQFLQHLAQHFIPIFSSLFQPIQSFPQSPHPIFLILHFISSQLLDVYDFIFIKFTVEIGQIKIE